MRDFYFALAATCLCGFMILQDNLVGLFLSSFILFIIGLFYKESEPVEASKYKTAYEALIDWIVENIEKNEEEVFGEYPSDEEIEAFLSSVEKTYDDEEDFEDEDDDDDDFYKKFSRFRPSDN